LNSLDAAISVKNAALSVRDDELGQYRVSVDDFSFKQSALGEPASLSAKLSLTTPDFSETGGASISGAFRWIDKNGAIDLSRITDAQIDGEFQNLDLGYL